jgi:stearoyl-CoA desaturase (Delta-9 desaturase)
VTAEQLGSPSVSADAALHSGPRDDVQPVANETRDRIITGTVTIVPILALAVVGWQVWNEALHVSDLVVLVVTYALTGFGVTVGFHRLFTHRSFKTSPALRFLFAALGSAAIEGPVISWVADHRKHHAFSDIEGDPHSPHVDHGHGLRGALLGLYHAHVGWLFIHTHRGLRSRYAPDLLKDPVVAFVDRTFVVWTVSGFLFPFGLGWLVGGSFSHGLSGMLWGGLVRALLVHHSTFSINSLCHFFGRRAYATDDESRNVFWLALPTLGESWHNNHHAFPTSAEHGLKRWQLDPSALLIRGLERVGLVWDVVRVSPERQAKRTAAA